MGNCLTTDQKIDRALRIRELEIQLELLKSDNEQMRGHLRELQKTRSTAEPKLPSEVSSEAIDAFVNDLMANPDTNIAFVPDMIERPLERKMLILLMNSIAKVIDSTSIQFLGHEIKMNLTPISLEQAPQPARLVESPKVHDFKKLTSFETTPVVSGSSLGYSPERIGAFFDISTVLVNAVQD